MARAWTTAMLFGTATLVGLWNVPVFIGLVGVSGVGAGLWWLGRCHHPRPLGLLPPTWNDYGERQHAQWFCAACGKTWAVQMDRNEAPVQRFTGYDESKAPEAARRATALEARRREMAVLRAGLRKPQAPPRRNVVPVRMHRDRAAS